MSKLCGGWGATILVQRGAARIGFNCHNGPAIRTLCAGVHVKDLLGAAGAASEGRGERSEKASDDPRGEASQPGEPLSRCSPALHCDHTTAPSSQLPSCQRIFPEPSILWPSPSSMIPSPFQSPPSHPSHPSPSQPAANINEMLIRPPPTAPRQPSRAHSRVEASHPTVIQI